MQTESASPKFNGSRASKNEAGPKTLYIRLYFISSNDSTEKLDKTRNKAKLN